MARAKKVTDEEVRDLELEEDIATADEQLVTSKKYALNKHNFTAVGETFITLCKPEITIETSNAELIKVAEEQVKLGVLKVVE